MSDADRSRRPGRRRHALLLSGSLGMGHDVMAQACAGSLQRRGWATDTHDAMALLGSRGVNAIAEAAFRRLLSVAPVYDGFHFSALRTGNRLARFLDREASRRVAVPVDRMLREHSSELVVSVFATAAGAVDRVKARHPGLLSAVFCTDACAHSMWVHPSTDLFLVTSEVAARSVRRFRPHARVAVVPAPVRPAFYDPPTQDQARAGLDVPPGEPCVLMMSGAWGIGPVAQAAAALASSGVYVLAVAGRNTELAARLHAAAARHRRLRPFGFTDRVPELMAAADVVVTSAGDTCSEARTVGRPLLLLDVVPGHGRDNLQHELELGGAEVASGAPELVVQQALAVLGRVARPLPRVVGSPQAWETAFPAALGDLGLDIG